MRGGQQGGSCSRNWARWVSPGGCHPVGVTKGIKQLTGPGSFREKKPSPTWGLAATEGVCARLWECLVQGQAFLCNRSQTKRGFNPGWRDGMEPDPEKFKCQTLPTFSRFLFGGWLQSQLPSVVQGGISVSAKGCEVQPQEGRERPWVRWEDIDGAPHVPESRRWCKRSSLTPDSTRLVWLCPLLLPWRVNEDQVASSGPAMSLVKEEKGEITFWIQKHPEKRKSRV